MAPVASTAMSAATAPKDRKRLAAAAKINATFIAAPTRAVSFTTPRKLPTRNGIFHLAQKTIAAMHQPMSALGQKQTFAAAKYRVRFTQ